MIPYKVDYKTGGNNQVTFIDFLPNAVNLESTETGIREIIGRIYYIIKRIIYLLNSCMVT